MTDRNDLFPDIRGCVVLTDDGLGIYDGTRRFVPEAALTTALAAPIRAFRDYRRQHNDTAEYRLAIVYADYQPKPWHSATLALEDRLLRLLYPTSTTRVEELTPFQRRNKEKSLYRGLELILDHHLHAGRNRAYYCPVLYHRGTTLDQYLPWTERARTERDRTLPVIEVINLLAGVGPVRRDDDAGEQLTTMLRRNIMRPERRTATNLVLLDGARRIDGAGDEDLEADPYAAEPDQWVRDEISRHAQNRFREWNYADWFDRHSSFEHRNNLARWVSIGYTHPKPLELRSFDRFRALGEEPLRLLAEKNPVFVVPPGTRLLERGTTDNWNLYLLNGEVELRPEHDAPQTVSGGTPSARSPIGLVKPRLIRVTARTRVDFLWLYEPMVTAVARLFRQPSPKPIGSQS